jgi:hypothetical protein
MKNILMAAQESGSSVVVVGLSGRSYAGVVRRVDHITIALQVIGDGNYVTIETDEIESITHSEGDAA